MQQTVDSTYFLRLVIGETDGEAECRCCSASPDDRNSGIVPCERVRDVDSGISVRPLILSILAVSSTCARKC